MTEHAKRTPTGEERRDASFSRQLEERWADLQEFYSEISGIAAGKSTGDAVKDNAMIRLSANMVTAELAYREHMRQTTEADYSNRSQPDGDSTR